MKALYHFQQGLTLKAVAVNVDDDNTTLRNEKGEIVITGCKSSDSPKDGCWTATQSEAEEAEAEEAEAESPRRGRPPKNKE